MDSQDEHGEHSLDEWTASTSGPHRRDFTPLDLASQRPVSVARSGSIVTSSDGGTRIPRRPPAVELPVQSTYGRMPAGWVRATCLQLRTHWAGLCQRIEAWATHMLARMFAIIALVVVPSFAAAQEMSTYNDLLAQYRCPVADRLEQIYRAFDTSDPQNWFLIVYFAAFPHDYVQCVFDPRTRLLCEAASGFYDNVAGEPRTRWLPREHRRRSRPPRLLDRQFGGKFPGLARRHRSARLQGHRRFHLENAA